MRDPRRNFKNFLGQIINATNQAASTGDEDAFADKIDERFFLQRPPEQLECLPHPQMNDGIERLAFHFLAGETGIVL